LPLVLLPGLLPLALAGCSQGYSPNIYASDAAQEEASVQRGMIIGVRQIIISPDGTVGAAAGGAVGGVAGSQVAGAPVVTALGAIGGTLVGGIGGAAAAQAVGKTKGWEYIVQEEPGDKLVSVTQTSKAALPIGLHVLVIAGTQQARIVPDYTVQVAAAAPQVKAAAINAPGTGAAPNGPATDEIDISPVLPAPNTAGPSQVAPITVATDPATAPAPASAQPAAPPPAPMPASGEPVTPETENAGSVPTESTGVPVQVAPTASTSLAPENSTTTVSP
jgi:outer membrane lipoprotein SlyB